MKEHETVRAREAQVGGLCSGALRVSGSVLCLAAWKPHRCSKLAESDNNCLCTHIVGTTGPGAMLAGAERGVAS